MKKKCEVCQEWYTPEDLNLDPSTPKGLNSWHRRKICAKKTCQTLRKRRNSQKSKSRRSSRVSGRHCDICGRLFYPCDFDLDMREKSDRAKWAALKFCTNPECHDAAKKRLEDRHRPKTEEDDAALELSLACSVIKSMREAQYGTFIEAGNPRLELYRKMMGKRM